MPTEVSSRIKAPHTVMTHRDDCGVFGPGLQDFLRKALIDQHASGDACECIFLGRTHVEELDFALFQQLGSFAWCDLQIFFHFLAPFDVFDEFIHVSAMIHSHGSKRIRWLEAATAAPTNVVFLKQRPLR